LVRGGYGVGRRVCEGRQEELASSKDTRHWGWSPGTTGKNRNAG
jgi:hypothetical protein